MKVARWLFAASGTLFLLALGALIAESGALALAVVVVAAVMAVLGAIMWVFRRDSEDPVRLRHATNDGFLMGTLGPGGSMLWSRNATVCLYNRGGLPINVREVGWVAGDGSRLRAAPTRPQTLEPGKDETCWHESAATVLEFHRKHRGIAKAYVLLAGDDDEHTYRVPTERWIPEVEAMAAKPRETYH